MTAMSLPHDAPRRLKPFDFLQEIDGVKDQKIGIPPAKARIVHQIGQIAVPGVTVSGPVCPATPLRALRRRSLETLGR